MRTVILAVVVLMVMALASVVMAVPPGKTIELKGSPEIGKVILEGKTHAAKGVKCMQCHPKIFKMKKGANKMTMKAINEGQFCGSCHNGEKAFKASDPASCKKCHIK